MRSGVNVTRYPNQKIPDDFLMKLFETHTTALGYAVVTDGEVESGSFLSETVKDQPGFEGQDTFDLLTAYETIEAEHPDKKVFYWLYQADNPASEFSVDSLQPYTILADEDKVLLSVILEGEFNKDYQKDTTDTQEYHVVAEYISSKIEAIYKQTGGNLEKTLQVLDSPQVRGDMQKIMQPRGEIVVIPAIGKPFAYSENKLRAEFKPWGYSSKTLGYSEPGMVTVPPAKTSVPATGTTAAPTSGRPLTMSEKKARDNALKGSTAPAVMPENAPQPDVPDVKKEAEPVTNVPGQPVDHPNLVMRDTVLHARPEKGIPLAAAKAFWSRNYNGKKPEDEKAIWAGFPANQLKHDSPIRAFIKSTKKPADTAMGDAMKKAADQKKPLTATADVDKTKGPIQIMTVEDRQKARALIEADREANKTKTFAEILESEKEFRPYTEQTGTNLNDACRLSIKTLYEMGNRSLANLCKELTSKLVEIDPSYGEPPAEKKVEEPAPAVSSKKLSVKERLEQARQAKVA